MIKSKFRIWAIMPFILSLIIIISLVILYLHQEFIFDPNTPIFFASFFSLFFIYFLTMLIFGELRTKSIKVYIDNNSITKRNFIGLGIKTKFELNNITGFKTSNISSKSETYEYLYIMFNDKKIVKLSEFYHKNYK